ncbi:hypothetical protein [Escherichia coli]|uniref:hypothetical protein n=1 Tax=Escherichia coli TaxID=562 RepID=UPI00203AF198|nr:hypothetical protein [Escherichia coli]
MQRKAPLALRSAVGSGGVLWPRSRRHPWRLRCRSAAASSCGSQSKEVVGLAASACKGFMPARRRLAAAARAAQKAARHSFPPRQLPLPALVRRGHAKANPGQAAVPQSAVPSLADSLPPAPADPAPWSRHAAGGGLAAPRHGVPETDLVESGMTGSWWW